MNLWFRLTTRWGASRPEQRVRPREVIAKAPCGLRPVRHFQPSNGRAFSGEPSERSERSERKRGRRVRCNAMFGVQRLAVEMLITPSRFSSPRPHKKTAVRIDQISVGIPDLTTRE
jgi:hypothetical protein